MVALQPARIALMTDLTDASARTIPAAASLARELGARLRLVHQARWPARLPCEREDLLRAFEQRLAELAVSEPFEGDLEVETELVRGGEVEDLVTALESADTELVVASGRSEGAGRAALGSFAERLLRIAPCPVLIVPPESGATDRRAADSGAADSGKPVLPGAFHPRRIFAAVDLSRGSQPALFEAGTWAHRFGARLRLHSVVERRSHWFGPRPGLFDEWVAFVREAQEETHRQLETVMTERFRGVELEKSVTVGHPEQEILREAGAYGSDLLVMGTHGRAGIEDVVLGSVLERVACESPCALLVVRADEATWPGARA